MTPTNQSYYVNPEGFGKFTTTNTKSTVTYSLPITQNVISLGADAKPKEALRFDQGKPDLSLMPFEAVMEINKVLDFGAKKYDKWNWTNGGGMSHTRVIASCLRHLFAYMRGEDKDPESGLSHLSHAGCNILFLIYYKLHPEIFDKDDRFKLPSKNPKGN